MIHRLLAATLLASTCLMGCASDTENDDSTDPSVEEEVVSAPESVNDEDRGARNALFQGKRIDLTKGWGDAKSCVFSDDDVRCFASNAEADAAIGASSDEGVDSAQWSCPTGYFCLYAGINGWGNRSVISVEAWRQVGFAADSYRNRQSSGDYGHVGDGRGHQLRIRSGARGNFDSYWRENARHKHG